MLESHRSINRYTTASENSEGDSLTKDIEMFAQLWLGNSISGIDTTSVGVIRLVPHNPVAFKGNIIQNDRLDEICVLHIRGGGCTVRLSCTAKYIYRLVQLS